MKQLQTATSRLGGLSDAECCTNVFADGGGGVDGASCFGLRGARSRIADIHSVRRQPLQVCLHGINGGHGVADECRETVEIVDTGKPDEMLLHVGLEVFLGAL